MDRCRCARRGDRTDVGGARRGRRPSARRGPDRTGHTETGKRRTGMGRFGVGGPEREQASRQLWLAAAGMFVGEGLHSAGIHRVPRHRRRVGFARRRVDRAVVATAAIPPHKTRDRERPRDCDASRTCSSVGQPIEGPRRGRLASEPVRSRGRAASHPARDRAGPTS